MITEPKLEQRAEQPYAAIPIRVTMSQIGSVCPPLVGEVFGWLGKHGVAPKGAPFFRYLVIDMAGELEMEVGVPVATAVAGDDRVKGGVFPAGRYATLVHTGPYPALEGATGVPDGRQLNARAR
jgi:effector-binding domain-containing protein